MTTLEKAARVQGQPFAADKIYGHMDRVREWLETGDSRPITYEIDLTNICNQKCPHCFGYYPERDQARMHWEEAQRIVLQVKEFGGRGITFTGGGDPLVSPFALEAVEYARSLGLDVGFITNAQALTEEKARVLVRNCQWIRVSLDAASPKIFKLTHGMEAGAFYKVLDNIRMLVQIKKETGSASTLGASGYPAGIRNSVKDACTVGVGFLTSNETKEDIYAFAVLGRNLGVDYAQYRPLLRRQGEPDIDYSDGEILSEMRRAAELSGSDYRVLHSEHKYKMIQEDKLGREYKKCYGQNFAAVVSADKKMYVCCHMRGVEKYCIGDLAKQDLAELWNSPKHKQIADSVDFKDCPPLCRCDSFNNILWRMKEEDLPAESPSEPKEHPNFI